MHFAEHSIGKGDAEAWQALFADAAARPTRFLGTPADTNARAFVKDLISATNAAEMTLEEPVPTPNQTEPPESRELDLAEQRLDRVLKTVFWKETLMNWIEGHIGSHIKKLASGGFGLARTYWLFGGLTSGVGLTSLLLTPEFPIVAVLLFPYWIVVGIGIWRAATRYEGRPIWRKLAKINEVAVTTVFVIVIALLMLDL